MLDNIIVDEAVIKHAMEFAASALKVKPDALPDILKLAKGPRPARPRQNSGMRNDQKSNKNRWRCLCRLSVSMSASTRP